MAEFGPNVERTGRYKSSSNLPRFTLMFPHLVGLFSALFTWQRLGILDLWQFDKLNYRPASAGNPSWSMSRRARNAAAGGLLLRGMREGEVQGQESGWKSRASHITGELGISCEPEEKWVGTTGHNIRECCRRLTFDLQYSRMHYYNTACHIRVSTSTKL